MALLGDTHLAPGAGVISRSKAQLQPHLLRQQVPLVRHAFWFCCSAALPHRRPYYPTPCPMLKWLRWFGVFMHP